MEMNIKITETRDLLILKAMLDAFSTPAGEQPAKPESAVNDAPAAKAAKKGNGATDASVEEKTAPEAATVPPEQKAAPEAPVEPETANPFAEEAAKPKKVKKPTREDVNAAFQSYITAFGQTAAMADIVKLLTENFQVSKIKDIPTASFEKAMHMVQEAIDTNAFNRERI